ncbi:nucleotide sugar dehydrogenase [Listeria grandensis]|uniref:Nucleotide sugar dehydrogenase n=1 Tax=Listeria grandensis TaxID=1494963 RepID=A0A7X0Y2M0_9LIST|nr:nucleotide sugar dehydrogenase [Listeria grandensis]MBC1935856.1 nucleotide sugar dehydrogenase [Listeria grandensis]
MKIVTIGLGYIGLPTAIMFANHDHKVIGVDVNAEVIKKLNNKKIHIEEPFLQEKLEQAIDSGNFRASTNVESADAFIVAVPTPNKADLMKSCDLTYVKQAVVSMLPYLQKGNVVIIESTIAPKTTEREIVPLIEAMGYIVGEDIYVLHCPERVLPGKIVYELIHNDRIIGGMTPKCTQAGIELYQTFVTGKLIPASASTAELSKLMENTFRDVNIALANELVKIGTELEINALEVIELANRHPRVNLHQPGPGVGGHCLAVDPYFVAATAPLQSPLIRQAREINQSMPTFVVEEVKQLMGNIDGKKIAVFGLTYKGNIDDIRESPAMTIYKKLLRDSRYEVVAYDPHVKQDFVEPDINQALLGADLILILADHDEFKDISKEKIAKMNSKIIFDTKRVVRTDTNDVKLFHMGDVYRMKTLSGEQV